MPNKTIYIRDEDMPLFEGAQKLEGESLSALVTRALRGLVSEMQTEKRSRFDQSQLRQRILAILAEAEEARASTILLEPDRREGRVRIRVDGSLRELCAIPNDHYEALINAFLTEARLDPEGGQLREGRLSIEDGERLFDYTLCALPTALGRTLSLQRIRPVGSVRDLREFEPEGEHAEQLEAIAALPHGLVVVTGPTGCGKTSTLYSLLKAAARRPVKIMTVENPVDTILPGCIQIPTCIKDGFGFQEALRGVMLSDPDVVMVAEIRDAETARRCVELAITGHLVLFTLHASTAAQALTRLLDIGIPDFLLRDALAAVIGQRLLRKLCSACKDPQTGAADGCEDCQGTGYRGRLAAFEILEAGPEIKAAIAAGAEAEALEAIAIAGGMTPLRQDAEAKAKAGWTSLSEVERATR